MLNANVSYVPREAKTPPYFTPAPWRGLKTIDSYITLPPDFALSLQNFICVGPGVAPREGNRDWATELPGEVTSLFPYKSGSALPDALFAVVGSAIYDVTSGGAAGAPEVTGLDATEPYWQWTNQTFSTAGTNFLVAVNGSNAPLLFNGSSWITCTQVAVPAGPGQFTTTDNNGQTVDITSFVDVCVHNQRVWFVAKNTTRAYYLDIAAVGGQLYAFDFGPFFNTGGALFKLAPWTMDQGGAAGISQLLAAISDTGDVAVYAGSDVANAATWGLMGTYTMGSPVGLRGTTQYGGDVLTLGNQGLIAMSKLLQSARVDTTQALTYNISNMITSLTSALSGYDGFEVIHYPAKDLIILNIPQGDQDQNFQFVMNTITGGWSQFTDWPARCFCLFNDALYFGANGTVQLAFIGHKDGADINGAGGDTIIATGLTSFSQMADLGLGGAQKHVKLVKPYITTGDTNPTIRIGVNTDYNLVPIVGSATLNPVTGAVWDNAQWDNPNATWVGSLTTFNQWSTPLCYPGTALALAISISAVADTVWAGTNWVIEPGNIFG